MAYAVVKLLQTPLNNVNRVVVIPSLWILLHRVNSVVVAYPREVSEVTRMRVARRESCLETWPTYTATNVYETDSMDDAERYIKSEECSALETQGNNSQQQANTRKRNTITGYHTSPSLVKGVLHSTLQLSSPKKNDQLNSPVTKRTLIAPVLENNGSSETKQTPKRKTATKPKSEPKRKKKSLPAEEYITPEDPKQVSRSRRSNNKPCSTKQCNNMSIENSQKNNLSPFETLSPQRTIIKHSNCSDGFYTDFNNITKEGESGKVNINGGQENTNPDASGLTTQSQKANKAHDDHINNTNLRSNGRMNDSNGKELDQTTSKKTNYDDRNLHRKCYDFDLKVATFSMYVSRLDKSVTEEKVKDHFEKQNVKVLEIKLLSSSRDIVNYSSFKVTLNESVRYKVFKAKFWPHGIVYRQYSDNKM